MTAVAETTTLQLPLIARIKQRLAEPLSAFGSIWHNRALRRLEYAWVGSIIGTWAYAIALGVYAYHIGGAAAVGLAGLIRTLPTIAFGPMASALGDRFPRVRVMVSSDLVRGVLFTAAGACIAADGPPGVVYALAGLIMLAASSFRPAQAAILPSLTNTPEELTAMNVVSSTVESVGFFAGPALGGILLAATSSQVVFFASAATCIWSATMLIGLGRMQRPEEKAEEEREEAAAAAEPVATAARGFFAESLMGFSTIFRNARLRTLVLLFTAQTLVAGALNVFVVVLALRLYHSGPRGVGALNAALGVGGVLGAAAAAALIGGHRLARGFAFGMVLWGIPLVLIGGVPAQAIGLIGLAAIGLGNTVIDVSGFTLLQRAVPDEVLARVFGVLETVLIAGIGIGALITPAVIHAVGVRGALLIIGGFLPVLTILTWARLRLLDAGADVPPEHVELLKNIALFRPLRVATIELLASKLETRDVASGEVVITEGEPGDRFYVISEGTFTVHHDDGQPDVTLGPGGFFGEIALLRHVPRTATVLSGNGPGVLLSLTREDFVPAVTGIELLKNIKLFRPLPVPTIEFLASKLETRDVASGEVVITEGESGDRFYMISEGAFTVHHDDGQPDVTLGPGDFFGEIALLRDVPRTATVLSGNGPGVLFSLRREDFVPAVTGSASSSAAADEIVAARMTALSRPAASFLVGR